MDEKRNTPLIHRETYLERMRLARGTPFVKVVTGIRRCGKSSLLEMYRDELLSEGVLPESILCMDFDSESLDLPEDQQSLTAMVRSRLPSPGYVFLDEVQELDDWEKSVAALFKDGHDIYVTGSNSEMLSSEIATRLSGRYVEIRISPLSFSEYVSFRGGADRQALFDDYVRDGGFPAIALLEDSEQRAIIPSTLSGIYESVYAKDVIDRHEIRNPATMRNLLRFLMRNVGNRTSAKAAGNFLRSSGQKTSNDTIGDYLGFLAEAFLVARTERIDSKTKECMRTTDKFYASDLGIRNAIARMRPEDTAGILENLVYNELVYRYGGADVCDVDGLEIDFVVEPEGRTRYYQVCYSLGDPETLERELASLKAVGDNYPKTIVTYERYMLDDVDGIRIVQILDWLLGEERSPSRIGCVPSLLRRGALASFSESWKSFEGEGVPSPFSPQESIPRSLRFLTAVSLSG